jgi:hypothetical protein
MLSEFLIALLVLALSVYWFRYNCLSILKTRISHERAQQVAAANQLAFSDSETRLNAEVGPPGLQEFSDALKRDYKVLTCLLRYTAPTPFTIEQRMLMLDFRLMQIRYRVTLRHMTGCARRSLAECARILEHFANTLSERTAALTRQ